MLLLHTTPYEMLRLLLAAPLPAATTAADVPLCTTVVVVIVVVLVVCFFLYLKSISTHDKFIAVGHKWHFAQAMNMCVWDMRACMYILV